MNTVRYAKLEVIPGPRVHTAINKNTKEVYEKAEENFNEAKEKNEQSK